MTSDDSKEEYEKCKDIGADLLIEKPMTKESLNIILKYFNLL